MSCSSPRQTRFVSSAAACLLLAAVASPRPSAAAQVPGDLQERFRTTDRNNDGKIDIYQGRDGQDAYTINNIPPGGSITPANFTTTTLTTGNAPKTTNFAGNAYLVDMDGDGQRDDTSWISRGDG